MWMVSLTNLAMREFYKQTFLHFHNRVLLQIHITVLGDQQLLQQKIHHAAGTILSYIALLLFLPIESFKE